MDYYSVALIGCRLSRLGGLKALYSLLVPARRLRRPAIR